MTDNDFVYRDSSTAHEAGVSAVQRRLADSERQLSQAKLSLDQVQRILQQLHMPEQAVLTLVKPCPL